MRPRTYALTMTAAGAGLFLAAVAANVIIDPQAVFDTGFLPRSVNGNTRYLSVAAYQAAPERYDGVLFGSSRAGLPLAELSQRMNGVTFLSFAVSLGMLTDHVPMLEFVLRDKIARGKRLRAAILLLDVDAILDEQRFGAHPVIKRATYRLMPPALTGENPVWFWWRNLTAIQMSTWYSAIQEARARARPRAAPQARRGVLQDVVAAAVAMAGPASASAQPLLQAPASPAVAPRLERITERTEFRAQLNLLQRFVALCREHGTELVVAVSPLHRTTEATFDPTDLANAIDQFSRVVPVWDFTRSHGVLDRAELWEDVNHFHSQVAMMMLGRIFGDQLPAEWKQFGRRLSTEAGTR
jgi:hypothetical protein